MIRIGKRIAATLTILAMSADVAHAASFAERFVTVEPGVRIQVLDWGGTGQALILLAGLGYDAHEFDTFAPKLTVHYRVYALSRRGFGASSAPAPDCSNYSAERLADDVLAVMQALKIEHPVLIGHSIAGEELSFVGTRHPDRVAGLVYLDAGYAYAWYGEGAPSAGWPFDGFALRRDLESLTTPATPHEEQAQAVERVLNVELPRVQSEVKELEQQLRTGGSAFPPGMIDNQRTRINAAILNGFQVFTGVHCPVLAIFADPHAPPPELKGDTAKAANWIEQDRKRINGFADGFQKGNPNARVIRIAGASHFVFRSNEAEVLQQINTFIATLH